ncbi:hypothetical protein SLA2020_086740 [Shorea laevis]
MGGGRSESEKEKTKMRERQRRAITTKIFQGLRKHGGYHLSPRADINEVLRELAKEAGWVVDPDGTTYRSKLASTCCPVCGTMKTSSGTPTPTSSIVIGGTGECSTTASPRHIPLTVEDAIPTINNFSDNIIPLAAYMYGRGVPGGSHNCPSTSTNDSIVGSGTGASALAVGYQLQQQLYPQPQASKPE